MKKITILLVEDHSLIREALAQIINLNSAMEVVGECSDPATAVQMTASLKPDVILLDINLGNELSVDIVPVLNQFSKVIALTMHSQPVLAKKMIRNGASGYLTKNTGKDEIFFAIQEVMRDKTYICDQVKNILAEQIFDHNANYNPMKTLSAREKEIICLVKEGFSTKEIAARLFISVKTVEVHRYNVLKKMNLKNSAALVNFINQSFLFI